MRGYALLATSSGYVSENSGALPGSARTLPSAAYGAIGWRDMSLHEIVLPETKPETEWVRGRPLAKVFRNRILHRTLVWCAMELVLERAYPAPASTSH
jgi:hypothetical protein